MRTSRNRRFGASAADMRSLCDGLARRDAARRMNPS
jgi:hypothetical protein